MYTHRPITEPHSEQTWAFIFNLFLNKHLTWNTNYCNNRRKIRREKKKTPRRGIEPRSPAWQAGILTTILPRTTYRYIWGALLQRMSTCVCFVFALLICAHSSWRIRTIQHVVLNEQRYSITHAAAYNISIHIFVILAFKHKLFEINQDKISF